MKHINIQIQEAEKFVNRVSPEKAPLRLIIIKFLKTKDKEKKPWKQPERNDVLKRKGNPICMTADPP